MSYEDKKRFFKKFKDGGTMVFCACGCGQSIFNRDNYGRKNRYAAGHTSRRHNDGLTAKQRYYVKNKSAVKMRAKHSKRPGAIRIKKMLILEKGGQCKSCGVKYNGTNGCIFQFHHLRGKLFNITLNMINRYNLLKVRAEAAKCDLLCGNCHAIHHFGKW